MTTQRFQAFGFQMIDAFWAKIEKIPTFLHNFKYIYFVYHVKNCKKIQKLEKTWHQYELARQFAENYNQR